MNAAAPGWSPAADIAEGLAFLADIADPEDPAQVAAEIERATRVAAFLEVEGLAEVLAVVRDGTDAAADMLDGAAAPRRVRALRDAARALSAALAALSVR